MKLADDAVQATHGVINPHVIMTLADGDVLELAENALTEGLKVAVKAQLDSMRLHDDTGDPLDEGYMNAINELADWLGS